MISELLKHSDKQHLINNVPFRLRNIHAESQGQDSSMKHRPPQSPYRSSSSNRLWMDCDPNLMELVENDVSLLCDDNDCDGITLE